VSAGTDAVWTYRAEREIAAEVAVVEAAISAVVDRVWRDETHTVTAGHERVDAVGDVWLTWSVEATGSSTLVRVVLDELESGPDPTDALDQVLALVAELAAPVAG
jgi:hypothetical protein